MYSSFVFVPAGIGRWLIDTLAALAQPMLRFGTGRRSAICAGFLVTLSLLMACPGAQAQDRAWALYEKAVQAFEHQDFENSVLYLKQALTENPALLPGKLLLARIYLSLGAAGAADETLVDAGRLGADPAMVLPLRAQALLQQRQYEKLLDVIPGSGYPSRQQAQLLNYRAHAYLERGELDKADESFRQSSELSPTLIDAVLGRAMLSLRKGDLEVAWARATKASVLAPDDYRVWATIGEVHHVKGELKKALDAYEHALRLMPAQLDTELARAGLLLDIGHLDEAAGALDRLVQNHPLDPRPIYLQSVLLSKLGKRSAARKQLERAAALLVEIGEESIATSMQLVFLAGLAYYELGALEQAQSHLKTFVDRHPNHTGARKLLGATLLRSARSAEALPILEPALKLAPNDFQLLTLLGSAYLDLGRHEIATSYLEKAAQLSAGAAGVRVGLALSRISQGFTERGLSELKAVFAENPKTNQIAGIAFVTLQMKQGRFDLALPVAQRLHRMQTDDVRFLNLLGMTQFGTGDLAAARQTYQAALKLRPDAMPVQINLAKLERAAGALDVARKILDTLLQQDPTEARAMLEYAAVERASGKDKEALRWLQKAHATEPNLMQAAVSLIDLYLALNRPKEALETAQDAESRAPENLDLLAALARCHLALQRQDHASSVYRRMALLAGFDVPELNRVARLQIAIGDLQAAEFNLNKALQREPEHLDTRALQAGVLIDLNKSEQAVELARAIILDLPRRALGHALLGEAFAGLSQYPAAIESFRRALDLEPSTAIALRLVTVSNAAGRHRQALDFLQKWVQDRPMDGRAGKALAENYLAAGQLVLAMERYEALAQDERADADVLNNLAYIYDKFDDPRALQLAVRAANLAPNDPLIADTVGWLLVRRGDPARGLRYLREAGSRESTNPEIRYHIGAALVALDRHSEAVQFLREAVAASTDFEGANAARDLLNTVLEQINKK